MFENSLFPEQLSKDKHFTKLASYSLPISFKCLVEHSNQSAMKPLKNVQCCLALMGEDRHEIWLLGNVRKSSMLHYL